MWDVGDVEEACKESLNNIISHGGKWSIPVLPGWAIVICREVVEYI
jgi:hypothetical protein